MISGRAFISSLRVGLLVAAIVIAGSASAGVLDGEESGGRFWFSPRSFVVRYATGEATFEWVGSWGSYVCIAPAGQVLTLVPVNDSQYDLYVDGVLDVPWLPPESGRILVCTTFGTVLVSDVVYGPDCTMQRGFELFMYGVFGGGVLHLSFAVLREIVSWVRLLPQAVA